MQFRYLFNLMFSGLIISATFASLNLRAQSDVQAPKPGQMELVIKQAEWNGNPVKFDTLQTHQLQKGENIIIAYQNSKVAYLIQLLYKRSGTKINLSLRPITETADGKRHFGKMTKNQHEIENRDDGMSGELNETVTYENKTMSTCHVEFTYILY